jgi:putative FmdB family regulatory protein
MPIYAYKCASCGHADDVLQKLADALLTVCPKCGEATYTKQITAPQFQLKGSGWYVTDFRGGNAAPANKSAGDDKPAGDSQAAEKSTESKGESKSDAKPDAKPDAMASSSTPPASSTSTSPPA